jgi:hypothetical protein
MPSQNSWRAPRDKKTTNQEDNIIMSKTNDVPLIVTTQHRGVFFGFGKPSENKTIRLTNAQMCVYWSADVKGVLGLASTGPTKSCRIGPAVPAITLQDVTSITEASEEAAKAWASQPWN